MKGLAIGTFGSPKLAPSVSVFDRSIELVNDRNSLNVIQEEMVIFKPPPEMPISIHCDTSSNATSLAYTRMRSNLLKVADSTRQTLRSIVSSKSDGSDISDEEKLKLAEKKESKNKR